ncbi:hypothetical protein DL93DRAFT_2070846 [Clavulina sp. PMI_390]|nr:hypothetical protein DL93DRAFT_2070846 [Clavulina sp. PMI_390]
MSKYAKEAMVALGNRRHILGILVKGLELRFYYFDRAGSIRTTQLNLVRDLEKVVTAIININLLSLSDLGLQPLKGFDPQFPIGQVDSILGSEVSVDGVRYEVAERLHADPSLYGRGTVVWSATRRPLQDELVREIILHDDKTTEESRVAEERKRVAKRLKHEKIPSSVVLKLSWQLIHKKPDDDLYAIVEERGIKNVAKLYGSRIAGRLSDGPRDGLLTSEWYQDRVLRAQVFGPIYQPLSKIREIEAFKATFIGCINAHHKLYERAKIIHRDISPSNLMFETYGVGAIVDLEHAISVDGLSLRDDHDVPAPPTAAVGTPAFMSIDLHLEAEHRPTRHYYRFDLESFFYSLAWLATHFHFGQERYSTYFGEWVTGKDQDILTAKRQYMAACRDNSFKYDDSTSITETWLPALGKLFYEGYAARDAARTAKETFDDETLGGYVTYENFMNILASPLTAGL